MDRPETKYAQVGELSVAYQVTGEGPIDLVQVPQWTTHLEADWDVPEFVRDIEDRSTYGRLIRLDQLGAGMSDPLPSGGPPTIDAWLDSLLAVMEVEGVGQAALTGHSWGGTLAIAFAALHPDRTRALVIHGTTARTMESPDYPIGLPEHARKSSAEMFIDLWGTGAQLLYTDPEAAEDPRIRPAVARYERMAASPWAFRQIVEHAYFEIDVRDLLPHVKAKTLVLHSAADRLIPATHGKYIAEHIPGATFLEVPGTDHYMWRSQAADERRRLTREFLTGTPAAPQHHERVLATLLFTDIVGSTARAAELGDDRWRGLLDTHDAVMRQVIEAHGGRVVKQTGDGFLARFDAPARAIRCAQAARESLRAAGIDIRAAVHTGEVELRGEDIGGIGVHVAARILDSSDGSAITTSSTVRDLTIGSGIGFRELGRHELRGVPGEWTLLAVDA